VKRFFSPTQGTIQLLSKMRRCLRWVYFTFARHSLLVPEKRPALSGSPWKHSKNTYTTRQSIRKLGT
jgi:hypothetical protein